jgi:beta-lactam-binding protein with PASTA domain
VPVVAVKADETVPRGTVIDQNPLADQTVPKGSKVQLNVSAGSSVAIVPDVTGLSQADAKAKLLAANLQVGSVETIDANVDAGKVVKTDPKAKSSLSKGASVTLFLSSGDVRVPNVIGKDQEEATDQLTDLGLNVIVKLQPSDEKANTVIDQDLKDVTVDRGDKVTITVAQAQPSIDPSPSDGGDQDQEPNPDDGASPDPSDPGATPTP